MTRAGEGLTLKELQQVGAEAGIDPAYIAAAAAELDRPVRSEKVSALAGGPKHLQVERVVPGIVSEETWMVMVEELRRRFGKPGIAGQVGPVREWTPASDSTVRVTLRPEGGMTRLSVAQSLKEEAEIGPTLAIAFGGIALLLTVLMTAVSKQDLLLVLAFSAVLALVSLLGGRFFFSAHAQKQERTLEAVLDRLEIIALQAREAAAPESAQTSAASEHHLDDALDKPEQTADPASAQRRRARS